MIVIEGSEVLRLLDEKTCTAVMRDALISLEQGRGEQYLRTAQVLPGKNIFAFMPAWLDAKTFGAKVLTVFHGNKAAGLPSHQGWVMLFDAATGSPFAMVDATAVTAVRTGAVSAVATGLLARADAKHLSMLGCGQQARSHLLAIRHVRPIDHVSVWDIDAERCAAFAREISAETGLAVTACATAEQAVRSADILCTLTPSKTPVLDADWVRPGTHINAVGACRPMDRELPSDLVAKSKVYGDSVESVMNEAGDFLIPMAEGRFGAEHLLGTVGAVAMGAVAGRQNADEITLFEALGLAIEDIAAARYVFDAAQNAR